MNTGYAHFHAQYDWIYTYIIGQNCKKNNIVATVELFVNYACTMQQN